MSQQVKAAPAQNWMIALPQSLQLVGLVQVEGRRSADLDPEGEEEGLVAKIEPQPVHPGNDVVRIFLSFEQEKWDSTRFFRCFRKHVRRMYVSCNPKKFNNERFIRIMEGRWLVNQLRSCLARTLLTH